MINDLCFGRAVRALPVANKGDSNMKMAIIDTGVSKEMTERYPDIDGVAVRLSEEKVIIDSDFEDEIGHGTSIVGIVKSHVPDLKIYAVKVNVGKDEAGHCESMIEALKYVNREIKPDIINLSMSVCDTEKLEELYEVCADIYKNGTVLVAAFDNEGAIAYPAAFDCVVGVTSADAITKNNSYMRVNSRFINACAKGRAQRVTELNNEIMIRLGDSLACAHFSGMLAQKMKSDNISSRKALEEMGIDIGCPSGKFHEEYEAPIDFVTGGKAVLFPYNKEMHSLVRFYDLLDFEIAGIFDVRRSGKVGMSLKLQKGEEIIPITVGKVESMSETEYDMLIVGHTDELAYTDTSLDVSEIIRENLRAGKKVYSFDDFADEEITEYKKRGMFFSPQIHIDTDRIAPFGKLFRTRVPVIGVFGTRSKQGKWTLQLELRRRFLKDGYNLGELGTEPTAYLFGMDSCYHFGYNSIKKYDNYERIAHINGIIHDMTIKKKDIILAGSQSQTLSNNAGNISGYAIDQYIFMQALQPDAVILSVRYEDKPEYIKSTIQFMEAAVSCKVLSLVIFPNKEKWGNDKDLKISEEELKEYKKKVQKCLGREIEVYRLEQESDLDKVYDGIIDFFAANEDAM